MNRSVGIVMLWVVTFFLWTKRDEGTPKISAPFSVSSPIEDASFKASCAFHHLK
ncbi:hypothetical protein [Nitrospira sp. BLG_2]|uniref:hypothetical protein n=1 Tax=Nitrospira sp. BLG_2 TaxID=3397507 RepID=UPI003B9CA223